MARIGDRDVRPFVFEAAHVRVLMRGGVRVPGVDFDDPAEAIRFVRVARVVRIESVDIGFPPVGRVFAVETVALIGRRGALRLEVRVEVLLTGHQSAPGREPARAVAESALRLVTVRIVLRPQQIGTGGGTGELVFGVDEEPAVLLSVDIDRPRRLLVRADEFGNGQSVGFTADRPLIGSVHVLGVHDGVVRVFLVGEEHGPVGVIGVDLDGQEVVVVAELAALRLWALILRVKFRRVGKQGVSPADDRMPGVAFGDDEFVDLMLDRVDGGEGQTACGGCGGRACGRTRCGGHCDGQGTGSRGTENRATAELRIDDIAEIPICRCVAGGLEAGVVALQCARDGAALATHMVGHRQKGSHRFSPCIGYLPSPGPARHRGRNREGSPGRDCHRQAALELPVGELPVNPAGRVSVPFACPSFGSWSQSGAPGLSRSRRGRALPGQGIRRRR